MLHIALSQGHPHKAKDLCTPYHCTKLEEEAGRVKPRLELLTRS